MKKYIDAVEAAEVIAERTGLPLSELVDVFAEIPAADVAEVVHGKWELVDHVFATGICSNCHRQDNIDALATHCRYCGARMDGKDGE